MTASSWDLDRLLAPVAVSEFVARYWDHGCWHLPGARDKFAGLFGWDDLNRVLSHTRLSPRQLQLIRNGDRTAAAELFTGAAARFSGGDRRLVDQGQLLTQLRAGRSLLLADVQDLSSPVAALGDQIARALDEEVWFTLIASCGAAHAFDVHWDDQDTFILQLAGKKRWRLYGRTAALDETLDSGRQRPPTVATQEVVLEPGGLLYLPRGHWHDAETLGEPALQLMIWVPKRTGIDLVSGVVAELRRDARLLETVSRFSSRDERRARVAEIRRALLERLDEDALERLFARTSRRAEAPQPDLPWSISAEADSPSVETTVRMRGPALESGCVTEDARPLTALLAQRGRATVGDLVAAAGDDVNEHEVRSFVGELLASGVVVRSTSVP